MAFTRTATPLDIVPLVPAFEDGRLAQGRTVSAIFVFDPAITLTQPLVVTLAGQHSSAWGEVLPRLERERAVSGERQRIMQDMHDGLGSQLLTSLAAVERGALGLEGMAQVLRDAMDDMRLAIDTLSPEREGLLEALGNLQMIGRTTKLLRSGLATVRVPALKISAWKFTSATEY